MDASSLSIPAPSDRSGDLWRWAIKACAVGGALYHGYAFDKMVASFANSDATNWGNRAWNVFATVVVLVAFWRLFQLRRWPAILVCIGVWAGGTSALIEGFDGSSADTPWFLLAFTVGSLILVGGRNHLKSGF